VLSDKGSLVFSLPKRQMSGLPTHTQEAGQKGSRTDTYHLIPDLTRGRNLRVTHHGELTLLCSSVYSKLVNQKDSFSWALSRSAAATVAALLALLTMTAPLEAQTSQNALVGPQEHGVSAELGDDQLLRPPDMGLDVPSVVDAGDSTLHPSEVFANSCAPSNSCLLLFQDLERRFADQQPDLGTRPDQPNIASNVPAESVHPTNPADFNQRIYYKNKLEFGLDVGYLPVNIPFVFDFLLGDAYNMTPLRYTLVPVFASLRWQVDDVGGWSFLRGNWDVSFTASVTAIPRGPETRYFSYIMGIRRNFVQRNWKIAPYLDGRLGLGNIDAKEPLGVVWSQGQDFTFTVNMGGGIRYNFSPRYSISAGLNWMHISNLYLSQPAFPNYGINVYGPMFGIDVHIGKPHHHTSE
jgi:Lipid A 3-O-deacylase (PagL)